MKIVHITTLKCRCAEKRVLEEETDPFGRGKYQYTFEPSCKEDTTVDLDEEKAEGRAEGRIEAILDLLSDLGEISDELCEKILGEKDTDILRSYLKKAASAKSIEEFEALIKE